MKKIILILMLCCCVNGARLWAQGVPQLINYQGQLLGTNGSPLATGNYTLTFHIYDAAESGNLVWGPQMLDGAGGDGHGPKVPVVAGYFNVMLGAVDTSGRALSNAFAAATRYLEIKVGTNNPIRPRQQILSAPYALNAGNAGNAANAASVLAGGVNTAALANGAVTAAKLATGAISSNHFAPDIGFWTKSGTNLFYNAGNVGIGTSSPVSRLHVGDGDILAGAAGEEWIFHTRSTSGSDFLHITDLDGGVPQFQRGLAISQNGNVGIGTTAFTSKLEVRGDIRLGSIGQYYAPAAQENLRIIRGVVNAAGTILAGTGFTVTYISAGAYTVNFTTSFSDIPAVTVTAQSGLMRVATVTSLTASAAPVRTFNSAGTATDNQFNFIAIGPR